MAWTIATVGKTVVGNRRLYVLSCTADAATQVVATGFNVVVDFHWAPQSMSTAAGKIYQNVDASGDATNGSLGCSGFASGDVFYAYVYGH